MRKIAVFYHCYLSGGEVAVSVDNVIRIASAQFSALDKSGLSDSAQHISIGVSGSPADYMAIASMSPKSSEVSHNLAGVGELPTMKRMQDWCKNNPGWLVLYIHTKGAIHHGNPPYEAWRSCMERAVVWGWKKCVNDLLGRYESCGAHWLTPQRFPFIGETAYWGGNFWWARSDFLNTLPPIDVNLSRYEAEVWIGRGPRRPVVMDYAPHFPMSGC